MVGRDELGMASYALKQLVMEGWSMAGYRFGGATAVFNSGLERGNREGT